MPSITAMWRHWLRSCWVAKMWTNSIEQNPSHNLLPPDECGWSTNEGGGYIYNWECPELQRRVKDTIEFLTKGSSCKKKVATINSAAVGRREIPVDRDVSAKAASTQ